MTKTLIIIRKLMSLNMLPAAKIPGAFAHLRTQIAAVENRDNRRAIIQLFNYVEATWIESEIWSPTTWSAFMQKVGFIIIVYPIYFDRLILS